MEQDRKLRKYVKALIREFLNESDDLEQYHYEKYLEFNNKAEELLNSDEMPSKYETPKKGTRSYDIGKKQMEFSDEAQKHFSMYLTLKNKKQKTNEK